MRQFGHPEWQVQGDLVKGPGVLGIRLRDNHTDSPAHLDLDFVLDIGRPDGPTVSDCIQGYGRTTRRAQRKAVDVWGTVTAATVIELLNPTGTTRSIWRTAMPADSPAGAPSTVRSSKSGSPKL